MKPEELTEMKESFSDTMAKLQQVVSEYHQSKYFQDFKLWQAEWHRVNQKEDVHES